MWFRLTLVLALAACSDAPPSKGALQARVQERMKKTEAVLSKTPEPRSYRFDGNELKIIEVPVKDATGDVDYQRCFVWTNHEFKTSSISCGQMPEVILYNGHDR